jgi:hypothetical protein
LDDDVVERGEGQKRESTKWAKAEVSGGGNGRS